MPVVSGGRALHPVIREYERTDLRPPQRLRGRARSPGSSSSGRATAGAGTAPCRCCWSTPAGGSITVGEARAGPDRPGRVGPGGRRAASVALAQADGNRPTSSPATWAGRRSTWRSSPAARRRRRTRGELDRACWTALSLVDVESIGAGGGSIGWVDARGMLRVGPQLGRRRARARLLRPGRHRADRHRRPGGARLPRPGPVPRRRHGRSTSARPRAGLRPARRARSGSTPRRRRGASAAWRSPAWPGRCAPGSPPGASTPRDHTLLSFGGCGGAVHRRHRRRHRDAARCSFPSWPRCCRPSARRPPTCAGSAVRVARHAVARRRRAVVEKVGDELRGRRRRRPGRRRDRPADRSVSFEADLRFERQVVGAHHPAAGAPRSTEAAGRPLVADFRAEYARRYGAGHSMMLGAAGRAGDACGPSASGAPCKAVLTRAGHAGRRAAGAAAVPVGRDACALGARAEAGSDVAVLRRPDASRPGHRSAGRRSIDGVGHDGLGAGRARGRRRSDRHIGIAAPGGDRRGAGQRQTVDPIDARGPAQPARGDRSTRRPPPSSGRRSARS